MMPPLATPLAPLETKTLYALPIENVSPLKEQGTFWGYASTTALDKIQDKIEPGAFAQTLAYWKNNKKGYPNIYEEHDRDHFIGTCKKLYEDEKGLYIEGKLFIQDIPKAKEVYDGLLLGQKSGLSIGFYVRKAITEGRVRRIQRLDLVEVSIVRHPCNHEAKIHEFKRDHDPTQDEILEDIHQLMASLKYRG